MASESGHLTLPRRRRKRRTLKGSSVLSPVSPVALGEKISGDSPISPVSPALAQLYHGSLATKRASASEPRLISIDIGRSGALALFAGGQLVEIADMPVLADGPACRPTVNAALLAILLRRLAPTAAVVEHVAARPGEAPSGAFAFGRSRGVIEGVLGAQAIPIRFVTPAWWKRRAGIPAGADMKDRARSVAIARWPQHAEMFARARDHDRAEAALIGLAYLEDRRR